MDAFRRALQILSGASAFKPEPVVKEKRVDSYDLLLDHFTKRKFGPISTEFRHPIVWADHMAKSISSTISGALYDRPIDKGEINVLINAAKLSQLRMPYYYV